jgi:hypothetical protein
MMSDELADFRWLLSDQADILLKLTQEGLSTGIPVLSLAHRLRKTVTAQQAALILELCQLRIRARQKFTAADRMFFTRPALEMATDERIARFKSQRFAGFRRVADICCSIGGDLMALAQMTGPASVTGFDRDALAVMYARANLKVPGSAVCNVSQTSFADIEVSQFDAVHIDPDRRHKSRAIRGDSFSPTLTRVFEKTAVVPATAVKVAPATVLSGQSAANTEREWIGHRRECKQQVIWTGNLVRHPGCRVATRLGKSGSVTQYVCREDDVRQPAAMASQIGAYIYEPHNVVLAASLANALSVSQNLYRLAPQIVYYTGQAAIDNRLFSRFRILDVLPAGLRKVGEAARAFDIGELEVKKRGVPEHVSQKYQRLKLTGTNRATLLLTEFNRKMTAILAIRETGV